MSARVCSIRGQIRQKVRETLGEGHTKGHRHQSGAAALANGGGGSHRGGASAKKRSTNLIKSGGAGLDAQARGRAEVPPRTLALWWGAQVLATGVKKSRRTGGLGVVSTK